MLAFYGRHFIPKMPADTAIELVLLPGVAPTGRRVEVPLVAVVQLRGDAIVCERSDCDQAAVGVESARKLVDPSLPSNQRIRRAARAGGRS